MTASQIIDALGGTGKVAELCDVQPGAVSQWRKDGIPRARLMYLKEVRPDVFGLPLGRRSRQAAKAGGPKAAGVTKASAGRDAAEVPNAAVEGAA